MDEVDPNEADETVFTDFIEKMESTARALGLYLQTARGQRQPLEEFVLVGTDPVVRPFVVAQFLLGDEAFSDRVQHPEKYSDEAVMKGMEHATYESEAERIMRRFAESGELFDAD